MNTTQNMKKSGYIPGLYFIHQEPVQRVEQGLREALQSLSLSIGQGPEQPLLIIPVLCKGWTR